MSRSRLAYRHVRHAAQGVTMVEVLVAGFVMTLIFSGLVTFVSGVNRSMSQQTTENGLSDSARVSMDEMLSDLRGAKGILASRTLNGTAYTSSGQDVVFLAPGYDPATTQVVLSGANDAIALDFDSQRGVIEETVVPAAGSIRPARTRYTLARNVLAVAYTYSARETFRAGGTGSQTFTLTGTPMAQPLVLVDGIGTACTYNAGARTVTVNVPVRGANVQALYGVQPTDTAALPLISQVDVAVTFQGQDSRLRTYTFVMPGSARLRNYRN
jgi:Tfp pilus assembly protein PilV